MSLSPRIALRDALGWLLVQKGIVPSATLSGSVATGASSVTLTSGAGSYRDGSVLTWWDASGERPLLISGAPVGQTLAFSFDGQYTDRPRTQLMTGLQFSHASGALVASNLVLTASNPNDPRLSVRMCANGYPTVWVVVPDSITGWPENDSLQPRMAAEIIYHLPLTSDASIGLQQELLVQQQHEQADADIDTIIHAIADACTTGQGLSTPGGQVAFEFARQFVQAARVNAADERQKSVLYEQRLGIVVEGVHVPA